ncbi:MAG: hypothetical protein ACRDEA_18440, partial [Microcystaceae cyanobacterium]
MNSFFNVATQKIPTSQGDVEFPIKYFDGSMLNAVYLIKRESAAVILKAKGLKILAFFGYAIALINWFEYRQTSIGAYNELSIS